MNLEIRLECNRSFCGGAFSHRTGKDLRRRPRHLGTGAFRGGSGRLRAVAPRSAGPARLERKLVRGALIPLSHQIGLLHASHHGASGGSRHRPRSLRPNLMTLWNTPVQIRLGCGPTCTTGHASRSIDPRCCRSSRVRPSSDPGVDAARARQPYRRVAGVHLKAREWATQEPHIRRRRARTRGHGCPTRGVDRRALPRRPCAPARAGALALFGARRLGTPARGLAGRDGSRDRWRSVAGLDRRARVSSGERTARRHRDQDRDPRPRRHRAELELVRAGSLGSREASWLASTVRRRIIASSGDGGERPTGPSQQRPDRRGIPTSRSRSG